MKMPDEIDEPGQPDLKDEPNHLRERPELLAALAAQERQDRQERHDLQAAHEHRKLETSKARRIRQALQVVLGARRDRPTRNPNSPS